MLLKRLSRHSFLLILPALASADIVVDQFGYRTDAAKIAMARNPKTGFDALQSYAPGSRWSLVDSTSGDTILTGSFVPWNSGAVDAASGDQVWSMDFSHCKRSGTYFLVDPIAKATSPRFRIAPSPYHDVLRQALRTFYYQRAGQERLAAHAGKAWADDPDHLGPEQDTQAKRFLSKDDISRVRDLHGGWFGDGSPYKYTAVASLTAGELLKAYEENPSTWGDDLNIPESGNGLPDILDEALWGIRWLERMQNPDGSCLSLAQSSWSNAGAPSAATGPSTYGDASTSSSLHCAAVFALASSVLPKASPSFEGLSDTLKARALKAWSWARLHPQSMFHSNSPDNGTSGLGYYDQEALGSSAIAPKLLASIRLFRLTGDSLFQHLADSCLRAKAEGISWPDYVGPFQMWQGWLTEYASLPSILPATRSSIRNTLGSLYSNSNDYLGATRSLLDPYRSYLRDYTYQSNQYKLQVALDFWEMGRYGLPGLDSTEVSQASEEYLHDLHGRNPLSTAFLTSMSAFGATRSVSQIYHMWFADGTKWDQTGISLYGPPPGYLSGGPNPSYDLDACCPDNCATVEYNNLCALQPTPPLKQPKRKSWKDFNAGWPLNSWSVNENPTIGQVAYVRLLSKFVGIPPKQIPVGLAKSSSQALNLTVRRFPEGLQLLINGHSPSDAHAELFDLHGRLIGRATSTPQGFCFLHLPSGMALGIVRLHRGSQVVKKLVRITP